MSDESFNTVIDYSDGTIDSFDSIGFALTGEGDRGIASFILPDRSRKIAFTGKIKSISFGPENDRLLSARPVEEVKE